MYEHQNRLCRCHLVTARVCPERACWSRPTGRWLSLPPVPGTPDTWGHPSACFLCQQSLEKPVKLQPSAGLNRSICTDNLSLLVELVNDLLLLLDELLGLARAVAVDVSGGQHLLLLQPLHVGGQLICVLNNKHNARLLAYLYVMKTFDGNWWLTVFCIA